MEWDMSSKWNGHDIHILDVVSNGNGGEFAKWTWMDMDGHGRTWIAVPGNIGSQPADNVKCRMVAGFLYEHINFLYIYKIVFSAITYGTRGIDIRLELGVTFRGNDMTRDCRWLPLTSTRCQLVFLAILCMACAIVLEFWG